MQAQLKVAFTIDDTGEIKPGSCTLIGELVDYQESDLSNQNAEALAQAPSPVIATESTVDTVPVSPELLLMLGVLLILLVVFTALFLV